MRDLRRKLLSLGNHFFERLKTANFSTACGTSTLKSLPSRAFFVSDVHLRPRKHFSRCTLDCGFKTSESPALRGFVAERCPITGTSLYLVLKSNGLHRPKIRLKKFGFSLKTVPANIAKKLPPQRCSQPFLIPIFNFSHKRHTFAFTGESGYTTRLSAKDRTQRLTRRNRGLPSLDHSAALCRQRNTLYSATLLYTYISRFSGNPHYQQTRKIRQSCRHKFYPQLFLVAFSTSRTNGPRSLSRVKAGTHSAFRERSHTAAYTPKQGAFRTGVVSLLSERSARSPTSPGRVSERQVLPLLGLGRRRS